MSSSYQKHPSEGVWIRGGKKIKKPLSGSRCDSVFTLTAEINAKMALLSLFSRLSELEVPGETGRKWLSYVEQILVMNGERFVAFAKSGLYEALERIRSNNVKGYKLEIA